MNLLDKPFNDYEHRDALDMLRGNINRICVSEDPLEIVRMLGFATDRLSMLAQSRILELKQKEQD